jgi:hypothetical protein
LNLLNKNQAKKGEKNAQMLFFNYHYTCGN